MICPIALLQAMPSKLRSLDYVDDRFSPGLDLSSKTV